MLLLRRITITTLILLFVIYGGICGYIYFFQVNLLFHPDKLKESTKVDYGLISSELSIKVDEGVNLSGILSYPNAKESNKLVFFLHGNAGTIKGQEASAKFYTSQGFDFFSFDYRSFGKSDGTPSNEQQFFSDAKKVFKEVTSSYHPDSIVVVGYSLGTCTAAWLCSQEKVGKLILQAPYYSIIEAAQREYPYLPAKQLLKFPFETNNYLKKVKCPILLAHGDKDDVLPLEGSKRLAKLLNKRSVFMILKGQNHDDFEENNIYTDAVRRFISN
ncbi:MAG: alpha/beta hydrolase [Bacteroidota bacterium]